MISGFVLAYSWSIQSLQSSVFFQIQSDNKMSGVRKDHCLLHCLWGKECLVKDAYFIWLLLTHAADVTWIYTRIEPGTETIKCLFKKKEKEYVEKFILWHWDKYL